jgi:hypothetical protein
MATDFKVPFLGEVPIDYRFIELIEDGKRPRYAAGFTHGNNDSVAANDMGSDPSTDVRDPKTLLEKYLQCSLFPIFEKITTKMLSEVGAANQS